MTWRSCGKGPNMEIRDREKSIVHVCVTKILVSGIKLLDLPKITGKARTLWCLSDKSR